jgi:hypothetical protein
LKIIIKYYYVFLKNVAEIFSTLAVTLKYAKPLGTNIQSKSWALLQLQKTCMDGNFGVQNKKCLGKIRCMGTCTTTTTVVPPPTSNTTTVAAQVAPVHCLITIQHEGKVFCDTMMCHLAKGS